MKLNHPSISTGQSNQLVSLLPSAPYPLKSPRDNKIHEGLKRYHTYHPVTSNLADLSKNKRHSQNMVRYIMTPQRVLCVHLMR